MPFCYSSLESERKFYIRSTALFRFIKDSNHPFTIWFSVGSPYRPRSRSRVNSNQVTFFDCTTQLIQRDITFWKKLSPNSNPTFEIGRHRGQKRRPGFFD